jgi:dTDP-4-dehydrorhamnose reductase
MQNLRIAVSGTQGQLVRSLIEKGPQQGVEVVAVGRPVLDLADPRTIHGAIAAAGAQVIVSAAAYTNTEEAEVDPDLAETINARGAGALAECARKLAIPIIHMSTAYVFDGRKPTPYRETDPVAPLNAYGRTKLRGEYAVAEAQPEHVILRTSLVYSPFSRNFLTVLLKLATQAAEVRVVADQFGNPTAASDLAEGVLTVARNLVSGRIGQERYGIFHMCGKAGAIWADFAAAIFAISAEHGGPGARVVKITSAEYPSRVKRPANSSLDCSKIAAIHGVRLRAWQDSLPECILRILQNKQ